MKPKSYYVEFLVEGEYRKEYIESHNCDSAVETIKKKYNNVKIRKVGKASSERNSFYDTI